MKITIGIDVGKDEFVFKDINTIKDLSKEELVVYNKYYGGSVLIEDKGKRFYIFQQDIREVLYDLFLDEIPNILFKKTNREPNTFIQYSPCYQEKIKYIIEYEDDKNMVLKYEPFGVETLDDDDYYVIHGYDLEITLPKKEFLELMYHMITEYVSFYIKYSSKEWTMKGIEYNNRLFEKAEEVLASFNIPFERFRINSDLIKI